MSPLKRDELSIGNTSEPTIDFQVRVVSFKEGIRYPSGQFFFGVEIPRVVSVTLLMEKILHHLGCPKRSFDSREKPRFGAS